MEYSFYRFQRSIIRSLLSLGLGILLILNSRNVMDYLIFVLGGIFLMMGVFALISSLTHKRNFGTSEISGIGSIILGLLLLVFSEEFSKVFFYFLGFFISFLSTKYVFTTTGKRVSDFFDKNSLGTFVMTISFFAFWCKFNFIKKNNFIQIIVNFTYFVNKEKM